MIVIRLVMKKVASIMITIWQIINDNDGHIVGQGFDQITIDHQWLVLVAMITKIIMLVNGGARIMINLNPGILFYNVTSKWLVKIFVGTMIWSTSSCVYHRKVLILRIIIAKCLVKGCTGHDHPALTYPCVPWPDISSGPPWSLIWWSYQSLWSTICRV